MANRKLVIGLILALTASLLAGCAKDESYSDTVKAQPKGGGRWQHNEGKNPTAPPEGQAVPKGDQGTAH